MTDLLLIPGLGGDDAMWAAQMEQLASAARIRVPTVHFNEDSIETMAAAILAEHKGPLVVAGTSLGSHIALEMTKQAPQRLLGLALFGGSARPGSPQRAAALRSMIATIEESGLEAYLQSSWYHAVHPSRHTDSQLKSVILRSCHRVGRQRYLRQLSSLIDAPDNYPTLASIGCPVFVACGREDAITPLECSEEIMGEVANGQLFVIEQCGHLAYLEQPEAVSEILAQLLLAVGVGSGSGMQPHASAWRS